MHEKVNKFLLALFPSSYNVPPDSARSTSNYVQIQKGNKHLDISWHEVRFGLGREENFTEVDKQLVKRFIDQLDSICGKPTDAYYENDLVERSMDIAIFQTVFPDRYRTMLEILDILQEWKARTYEGKSVCFGIQIEQGTHGVGLPLRELLEEDFLAPISDGISSFIVIDANGKMIRLQTYPNEDTDSYLPIRFSTVAKNKSSVFLILTRLGDILLIKEGELLFSKKTKFWVHYSHSTFMKRLTSTVSIKDDDLKRAIYLTCLDVSFSKTGGIIAISKSAGGFNKAKMIDEEYNRDRHYVAREEFVEATLKGMTFQQTDRIIRKELLGIDGSTIIDFEGNYLAVGFIANVPGGSAGGGRTAAAIALSKFGAAIKISSDGYIQLFRNNEKTPIIKIL